MCHGGCGALVFVKNGKVTKIKGDPESPLNKGKMCIKGLSSLEHLYNPNRLKHPIKRTGKRGEGKWEKISWDEALDAIAEKIKKIEEVYGIEAVALGTSTGRHHFHHVLRLPMPWALPTGVSPERPSVLFQGFSQED